MGYAFEMFFDNKSEKIIFDIWRKLQEDNLPSYMVDSNSRPHISLGVYEDINIENASEKLSAFCSNQKKIDLFLDFIGCFLSKQNVIFIAPTCTQELLQIHKKFHALFKEYSETAWIQYLPGIPFLTVSLTVFQ